MNAAVLSVSRGIARVTGAALGQYQTAVIRIGFSATWLLFLLRELPHRNELYGPDGPGATTSPSSCSRTTAPSRR